MDSNIWKDVTIHIDSLKNSFHNSDVLVLVYLVLVAVTIACVSSVILPARKARAPYVGYRSFFEPTFLVRLRFFQGAQEIVSDGYRKFKDSMFWIRRNDTDLLVVSTKYVDELRSLPETIASPIEGHIRNLLGKISTTDLLLESNLHTRVLQARLTPNLGRFFPTIKEEHDFAVKHELPSLERGEKEQIIVYNIMLNIIARISARMFVGMPLCRSNEWLDISIRYTENVFTTVMSLRMFPKPLHPVLVWLVPSSYRIHQNLRRAKKLIVPLVEERRQHTATSNTQDPGRPDDMLQWMMDAADSRESEPAKLAHRQLILTLGAIHTTTMAATHAILDMCTHPEYIQPLRDEASEILLADGTWDKSALVKLRKMDSFLKESQRHNPPNIFAFNRVAMVPITLSDGTYLPKGTHFVVPSAAKLMDPSVVRDPEVFDGFRSYRRRVSGDAIGTEANKHQYTTTTSSELHFGHGKYSCPGRFFASMEIKMILCHILLNYNIGFSSPTETRPKNMVADDNIFPDPGAKVLLEGL